MKNRNQKQRRVIKSFAELSLRWSRPNELGADGVDHINIDTYCAKTELGKFLNTGFSHALTYPLIGNFASIDSLMAWLASLDKTSNGRISPEDQFRTAKSHKAIASIRKNRPVNNRFVVKNRSFILANAMWWKLQSVPKMKAALTEAAKSGKIIAHYSLVQGSQLRTCATASNVVEMVKILNVIAEALIHDIEPDFTPFVPSGQCVDLYGLKDVLTGLLGAKEVAKLEAAELEKSAKSLSDDTGGDYLVQRESDIGDTVKELVGLAVGLSGDKTHPIAGAAIPRQEMGDEDTKSQIECNFQRHDLQPHDDDE